MTGKGSCSVMLDSVRMLLRGVLRPALFLPGVGASVKDDNQCVLCLSFFFAHVFGVLFLLLMFLDMLF